MSDYNDLPFMELSDFPSVMYSKASACRAPIKAAINFARTQRPEKMEEMKAILQTALDHINQEEQADAEHAPEQAGGSSTVSDPLDELLGPTAT